MSAPLRIRDVNGMSVTVGMSTPAGGATTLYSDAACTTSLGTSTTLTADATLYVKAAGEYTLSVKVLGVELAGGAVQLVDRQPISFDVDADVLPARIEAGDGGAYQPVDHRWTAGLALKAGQIVENAGTIYRVTTDFTTSGSFDATNLTALGGANGASKQTAVRTSGGQVCFVLDDAHDDHYSVALPLFEARGGRCSLAITTGYLDTASHMTTAQMLDAFNRGHEMVAHSATHVDLTTRGTSTRVTEYAAKDTIEATIGVGNCRNYVAPYSSRNGTIDQELYTRFDNAFFGVNGQYVVPMNQQAPFQVGRFGGWLPDSDSSTPANHTRVLNLIRYAAKHSARVVIYGHEIYSGGLTEALLTEALDLCVSLGLPMVRLQDAFPRHHLLPDPTFEDATLLPWPGDGTQVTSSPAGVAQTHALQLTSTDATTKAFLNATMLPAVGGRSFRYQAAIDTTVTSGTGGASLAMEEYDATGTLLARTLSTPIAATTAWQWTSIDKILAAATVNVKVGGTLVGVVGSARFSTPWPSESYQQLAATAVISAISSVTGVPQSFDRAGSSKANAVGGTPAWTQNSAAWRGGYRSITNVGDYAEWTATLKAGTYTLEAEILKANNGGFLTPTIGGGAAGGDIDTYNASNLAARVENTGLTIPTDGDYTIRFTVSGSKNASSAGNVCRLSGFSLARTGA